MQHAPRCLAHSAWFVLSRHMVHNPWLTVVNKCASCEERSHMLHDPMHSFFKLPRPVNRSLQSTSGFLPKLYVPFFLVRIATSEHLFYRYKVPAGPMGGLAPHADPKGLRKRYFAGTFFIHYLHTEYLSFLIHSTALCDRCLDRICGAWFRCAYCAKDLCGVCEALDTHDKTHLFVVFKAPVRFTSFLH